MINLSNLKKAWKQTNLLSFILNTFPPEILSNKNDQQRRNRDRRRVEQAVQIHEGVEEVPSHH